MPTPRLAPSLRRLWLQHRSHDTGTVAAGGPFSPPLEAQPQDRVSDEEARTRALRAWLITRGYGLVHVQTTYANDHDPSLPGQICERSFFVVDLRNRGTLRDDLVRLGRLFGRDSVTYAPKQGSYARIATAGPTDGHCVDLGNPYHRETPPQPDDEAQADGEALAAFFSYLAGRPVPFTWAKAGHVVAASHGDLRLSIPEIHSADVYARPVQEALETGFLDPDELRG